MMVSILLESFIFHFLTPVLNSPHPLVAYMGLHPRKMLKITTMNYTEIHELPCIVVDPEIADPGGL